MRIVQLTPGAGAMYCGNCLRDNALVTAYRRLGHDALMVPLYLPLTLDEADASAGTPIFFGGLNVYLDQQTALFRNAPAWLRRQLARPGLLRWMGRYAGKTRPGDVADLTISMLLGESGNQARDLDELIAWLKQQGGLDAVCISNALLLGVVRRLRAELNVPVVCLLAGEDDFLDAMPEPQRTTVWNVLAERAREVDRFVAPSRYFAERMRQRLQLPADAISIAPTGIQLDGYPTPGSPRSDADAGPPTVGYLGRMCREKGLDTLVEAFIEVHRRGRVRELRLKLAGSCGPSDEPFVKTQRDRLEAAGIASQVTFHPNLDRAAKVDFLRSLTVFSVPARCSEALGLYLLEALAAGVPIVQPTHAAFPEVVDSTGGGVLCAPNDPAALAEALEGLLLDAPQRRRLADTGHRVVHERHAVSRTAEVMLGLFAEVNRAWLAGRNANRVPA